ncbi:DUF4179 domain-containing protein [Aneurinibacillus tyrosinisolvens]|uniref:DUF4179 domain-containing protein n=1 Tax=Aneurinibacillus tyrosinisolvens TaxID=1443435 RepID=UPI00063F9B1B|nr:DUF4179 domain-containing protein [Aneurinibacillus tyrosinisolvens]
MNDKKVDEMLRRFGAENKTEVPSFFSSGLDEILEKLPQHSPAAAPVSLHKKKQRRKLPYIAGAAAVTALCIFGSGFISPAMAQVLREVPLIGSVFEKVGDPILQDMSKQGLISQPQKTATDKGIEMRITDVFYDGSRLALGYKLKTENNQPLNKVENQSMPLQWSLSVPETDNVQWIGDVTEKAGKDGEYSGKIDFNFDIEKRFRENFTLQLAVEAIHGVKGSWKFSIPISTRKVEKASTTFQPMVTKKWNGMTYTVERVTFSPATTQVIVNRTVPKEKMQDFFYIGYDESGTVISGGPSSGGAPKDEGNGMVTVTDTLLFEAMKDIPKSITLEAGIPGQLKAGDDPSLKRYSFDAKGKFPVTIPLGGGNSITVHGIEFLPDKTIMKYEVKGNPVFQTHYFMLEDGTGKMYGSEKKPVRMAKDKYLFTTEFPKLDSKQTIKLKTEVDEAEGASRQSVMMDIPLAQKK